MYYLSRLLIVSFIFTIAISSLIFLGAFFFIKELKAEDIDLIDPQFSELKVIIGVNNENGRYITYSYSFNEN